MLLFVLFVEVAILIASFFIWAFVFAVWTTQTSRYWALTAQMREDGIENAEVVQGWVWYGIIVSMLNLIVWAFLFVS